jgi:hypothetical protein
MVKAYLRYIFDKPTGLVSGHSSNILMDGKKKKMNFCLFLNIPNKT